MDEYLGRVSLREITDSNRRDVEQLRVTDEQASYVASNAESLLEAVATPDARPWYRAVSEVVLNRSDCAIRSTDMARGARTRVAVRSPYSAVVQVDPRGSRTAIARVEVDRLAVELHTTVPHPSGGIRQRGSLSSDGTQVSQRGAPAGREQ